jgi:Domain of unknown function (DUF4476)
MKKIITFLFASVLFTTSFAQYKNDDRDDDNNRNRNDDEQYSRGNNDRNNGGIYNNQNSALVVNSSSQNRFVVTIDNINQYPSNSNNGNDNTVNVGALQAGNHTVTIYEVKRGIFGNQRPQQIYNSVLYFKPSTETNINISYNGQVNINERPLYNNGNVSSCAPGNNGNGRGYGYGRKKDKRNKHGKHRSYNDDDRGYSNQYPGNNRQISDYDFGLLKHYVRKEAFDDRRINIAKQAAGNSNFSTAQVRDLMGIFSFDDGKLDVAKYFYNRTLDRNNYYQLTDALSFGSSKDALLAFIRR